MPRLETHETRLLLARHNRAIHPIKGHRFAAAAMCEARQGSLHVCLRKRIEFTSSTSTCPLHSRSTRSGRKLPLYLVLRSLRPPPAPPSGCCKLDSRHLSGWPRLQCCSCSTPAEESKQVHCRHFHLSASLAEHKVRSQAPSPPCTPLPSPTTGPTK